VKALVPSVGQIRGEWLTNFAGAHKCTSESPSFGLQEGLLA